MKEHEGNPDCKHEWVTENAVICTNPPMWHRICKKCGRVEHVRGEVIRDSFTEIYNQFHV